MSTPAPAPPPPTPAPARRHILRNGCLTIVGLVILLIVGSFIADAVKGGGDSTTGKTTGKTIPSAASTPSLSIPSPPPPEPTAKPAGNYSHDCNYLLGNFGSTMRFVADANLHNTGNIGTVDVVKAHWVFAGGGGKVANKRVRVPAGGHKRVSFTVHATSDDIDAYQATSSGNECHVKVTMVKMFGSVH